MGRQVRPRKIYQVVADHLANPILPNLKVRPTHPPWFEALQDVPPPTINIRPIAVQLDNKKRLTRKHKAVRNLYKPQQITYPEDSLRETFYRDHPWELARPRMILETDGLDGRRADWSTGVKQTAIQLTGECVVQRQLWLMENQGLHRDTAYDIARREFYQERHLEELEKRIAVEEARYVGGYFGKSRLQLGMEQEDRAFERWKELAKKQTEKLTAMRSVVQGAEEGGEESAETLLEHVTKDKEKEKGTEPVATVA